MSAVPEQLVTEAKKFVEILRGDPQLLHLPELKFLKDYLLSMNAQIPRSHGSEPNTIPKDDPEFDTQSVSEDEEEIASEESEVELDNTGVIPEETDEPQYMGDDSIEVTEEMSDLASQKRSEGQAKLAEGDLAGAITLFTESITSNPTSAVVFAKRAACYVKLKKPLSAIRDCDKAISMNSDSSAAYKCRGLANKCLGRWESAYLDLQTSLKLDYSDDANEVVKEIESNYKKIREHNLKWERKREERKYADLKKARDARQKAYEKSKKNQHHADFDMPGAGMPGSFPGGMGGQMPGGMNQMFQNLFSDPEMMAAMEDPDIKDAFAQSMKNPAAAASNPKFANLMKKMQEKMGGPSEAPEGSKAPTGTSAGDDLD